MPSLKVVTMSSTSGSSTVSLIRFAREAGYHTFGINSGCGALLMNQSDVVVPASTPFLAVHGSGPKLERTRIGTGEYNLLLQIAAAYLKAISRRSPIVTPLLPPTCATGVGSL